jgi:drug/metabolite transporter (DMT)-like permease
MNRWRVGIVLLVGVVTVAAAAILIRASMESAGIKGIGFSLFIAALRLSIASLILLPNWRNLIQTKVRPTAYYFAIASGVTLGLHFAAWISSLSYTSIAASTTLVTTNPIWIAIISWFWFKEKLSRQSILGIVIALGGSIVIALGDGNTADNNNPLLGNFLALIGAWTVSFYMLFGREAQKRGLNTIDYISIVYPVAALLLIPLPFFWKTSYFGYPSSVYIYILLMAIFSQLIGHTCFNWAVTQVSPAFISLVILIEPVISSFLGWIFFQEIPSLTIVFGGTIVLLGIAVAIIGDR